MEEKQAEEKLREMNRVLAEAEDDLRKAVVNMHQVREVLIDWRRDDPWRNAAPVSGSVH